MCLLLRGVGTLRKPISIINKAFLYLRPDSDKASNRSCPIVLYLSVVKITNRPPKMAKPGMDEDLLLSVSPRVEKKHPDDEVREIVDSLHSSTYLHPTVQSFLQDAHQKDLFMEMIARQANMIKSRCQSFEDGQVTVFDKVLLHLTENGNRFDSVTAQEYFCEEFLGINKNGTPIHIERILRENTVMKAFIAQGKEISSNVRLPMWQFLHPILTSTSSCISQWQVW